MFLLFYPFVKSIFFLRLTRSYAFLNLPVIFKLSHSKQPKTTMRSLSLHIQINPFLVSTALNAFDTSCRPQSTRKVAPFSDSPSQYCVHPFPISNRSYWSRTTISHVIELMLAEHSQHNHKKTNYNNSAVSFLPELLQFLLL